MKEIQMSSSLSQKEPISNYFVDYQGPPGCVWYFPHESCVIVHMSMDVVRAGGHSIQPLDGAAYLRQLCVSMHSITMHKF